MASKKKADRDAAAKAEAEGQEAAHEPAAEQSPEPASEQPNAQEPASEEPKAQEPAAEEPKAPEPASEEPKAQEPTTEEPKAQEPAVEEPTAEPVGQAPAQAPPGAAAGAGEPATEQSQQPVADSAEATAGESGGEGARADEREDAAEEAPRAKPAVPGAHLEVDIVPEGVDPLGRGGEEYEDPYALEEEYLAPAEADARQEEEREEILAQPISSAAIDLAAGARYRATGKRKTAIARVTLRPGSGTYVINGRTLEQHFPRTTLQRNIRQPLEMVGYHERMDVVARLHGGGISAQAGALRHGVSRALLEADPNLRGELKRRGFLTRDSRAKERKKAGLKKARKRPQFSKR
jgi:small subunit ribosomal protein S9